MQNSTDNYWKNNDEYHERQGEIGSVENNEYFFEEIFSETEIEFNSLLELGAGEGRNIQALRNIRSEIGLKSVEINPVAADKIPAGEVYIGSVLDNPFTADLVLTKGVCIHINPHEIVEFYETIYKASNRYILLCEYFAPTYEEVEYRGEKGKLWRGDFAGHMMELYPDLTLVDYGFTYRTDGQDDLTYFLLEKS